MKTSGVPEVSTVLKHIADAHSLYTDGKWHPSLNESRNLIQALIDGISMETGKHGNHSMGLPGGTANRIDFLFNVGFLTSDEKAALTAGWGSLSAGSHPGVPEREQARIGLVLALEFRTTPYAEIRQLEGKCVSRVLVTKAPNGRPLGVRPANPVWARRLEAPFLLVCSSRCHPFTTLTYRISGSQLN